MRMVTEKWLNCSAQMVVIGGTESSWKPVTSGAPNRSTAKPILFNLFINVLDNETTVHPHICRLYKTGIHQMVALLFQETLTGQRNGLRGAS